MTAISRFGKARADADAGALDAELVEIVASEVFRKGFRHAVEAVRSGRHIRVDRLGPLVVADRMDGACIDDALDAMPAGRLINVVATDDVGIEHLLPRAFQALSPHVDDGIAALHGFGNRIEIRKIGWRVLFMGGEVAEGCQRRKAHGLAELRAGFAQLCSEFAGRAGEQCSLKIGHVQSSSLAKLGQRFADTSRHITYHTCVK